jgi:hypothetical protein
VIRLPSSFSSDTDVCCLKKPPGIICRTGCPQKCIGHRIKSDVNDELLNTERSVSSAQFELALTI